MSLFSRLRQATTNAVVNIGQGGTPHETLDGPKAFGIISAIAVIAIVGSGWFLGFTIRNATKAPVAKNVNATAIAQLNALKNKDTDGDGLSDYDELYTYHTSPYLKDSDGDGIPDNVEIKNGTDPNCPTGNVCSSFALLTSPVDANGNLTPAFLRQALKAAGVPQAQLDKTDDATLQKIYNDVVVTNPAASTNANTNSNATNVSANTNATGGVSQLDNLTPSQIRQLLIQSGVDQTSLNTVDDTTLKQIFTQAASTNTNQ